MTSDLLGELKDEYEELLASNPSWYLSELIAFGPKMYQLIFKDKHNGRVVKWEKMMKGISLNGNPDMLALSKVHLYRNPVLDFCSILQFGNESLYNLIDEVWRKMVSLRNRQHHGEESTGSRDCVVITFNQTIFKRELSNAFTDKFIVSQPIKKQVRVTQSK